MAFVLFLAPTTSRVQPDQTSMQVLASAFDATCIVVCDPPTNYVFTKATAWVAADISTVQNILDTAPVVTPQLSAQADIDQMSDFNQAIVLLILDQLNLIRSKLPVPLIAITPAQAIAAIRAKAATL